MPDTSNTGAPVAVTAPAATPAPVAAPAPVIQAPASSPAAAVDQIETVAKAAALGAAHTARLSLRGEIAGHPFSTVIIAFANGVLVTALTALLIHFGA